MRQLPCTLTFFGDRSELNNFSTRLVQGQLLVLCVEGREERGKEEEMGEIDGGRGRGERGKRREKWMIKEEKEEMTRGSKYERRQKSEALCRSLTLIMTLLFSWFGEGKVWAPVSTGCTNSMSVILW